MPIPSKPSFTSSFESVEAFCPVDGSVYVWGASVEERSQHLATWRARASNVSFVEVTRDDRSNIACTSDGAEHSVALRSANQVRELWQRVKRPTIYLDITGMRHHVWATLLRGAIETRLDVIAVYVEPKAYRPSLAPTENEIYDLSERIEGIAPLPGFASLRERGDKSCFVPLLGFEGTRTAFLISQLEPPGGKIIPIVGLPGFRPEYPFSAYLGNRLPLTQTDSWRKVRYATGFCPFDAYYVLQQISADYPGHLLKIAPIGTKPHAIASVLYAIANPGYVELVYDHPVRKKRRTEGTAYLHTYFVSALFR
jgi:hypothetical protein